MGMINVTLTIKNLKNGKRGIQEEFLVDSGAHYTVLPAEVVRKLHLKPSYKQDFSLADGRKVSRNIGSAVINFEGKELAVPVVLGEKDDSPLLGITTLKSFGLMLDPFKRRIYHSKLMLA